MARYAFTLRQYLVAVKAAMHDEDTHLLAHLLDDFLVCDHGAIAKIGRDKQVHRRGLRLVSQPETWHQYSFAFIERGEKSARYSTAAVR
jgi:hypothetical protein